VENRAKLPIGFIARTWNRHDRLLQRMHLSLPSGGPGADGNSIGRAVKPAAQGLSFADGTSLANEDQERRLKDVLGIVGMAQDASAHTPHKRAVPAQDRCERCSIATLGEAL
jgi:hypothetical protein